MRDKRYGIISLAMKAGAVASGETAAEEAVRGGKASLIVLAEDASDNTKKKFHNRSKHYSVPCVVFGDKKSLGRCIGKDQRGVLALTNASLAGTLEKEIRRNLVDGEN